MKPKKQTKVWPVLMFAVGVALFAFAGWSLRTQADTRKSEYREKVETAKDALQEKSVQTAEVQTQAPVDVPSPVDLSPVISDELDLGKIMAPRSLGNPDAPVRIDEYASLTCSHCAHFHETAFPQFKEELIDTGKVYFTFHNFPLNDPALQGAIVSLCLPEQYYFRFLSFLFSSYKTWAFEGDYVQNLKQNAKLAGGTEERLQACLDNDKITTMIGEAMAEAGKAYKIDGTPSFVINNGEDVIVGPRPFAFFDELVARKLSERSDTPE